jgi:hypothetical protein
VSPALAAEAKEVMDLKIDEPLTPKLADLFKRYV